MSLSRTEPASDRLAAVFALAEPELGAAFAPLSIDRDSVRPAQSPILMSARPKIQLELVQVLRLLEPIDLTARDFTFGPITACRPKQPRRRLWVTKTAITVVGAHDQQTATFVEPDDREIVLDTLAKADFFRPIGRTLFRIADDFIARVSETVTTSGYSAETYRNCGLPTGSANHASP